jgi:hypothetical protein
MRYMVLVKGGDDYEAGAIPSTDLLEAMGKYNEELVQAGVMLAGEGLTNSSQGGARVKFGGAGETPTVTDGPFTETKELIAGFWLWQVKSKDEAIEWLKRAPFQDAEIELRRVAEAEDFGDEMTPELREREEQLRARAEGSESA